MPWGVAAAAVSAGIGAVASSGKSGGTSSSQNSSNEPWAAQQPYLSSGLQSAQQIYDARSGTTLPTSYFAPQNSMQTQATQDLWNRGMAGAGALGDVVDSGRRLLDGTSPYAVNAGNLAASGIGARDMTMTNLLSGYAQTGQLPGQSTVNPALASGVTSAATGGLSSLGQGQSVANQVAAAGLNPGAAMTSTVNGANQFINNDVLQGQIDAVGTDISRNLNETTLPGIRAAAQTSGNVNSSREGALEAIAGRGANENLANAAASIRGNAYNTGATLASQQYQTGLTSALGAAGALNTNGATAGSLATTEQGLQQQQQQFGTTAQLGAANSAANQNLGWQTADTAAKLAGNQQVGNNIALGTATLASGVNNQILAAQAAQSAGTYQQQQDQQSINNSNQVWQTADQRQQQLLQDYWNVVGKPLGSSSAGTSTTGVTNGNPIGGAIGGLTTGYGLAKNLTGSNDPYGLSSWLGGNSSGFDFGGSLTSAGSGISF